MNIIFTILLQVYFAFGQNIGFRDQGEYVLYQKPNPDMKIGPIKLYGKLKKVNINKIQETIGSDWPLGVVTYFLDTNSYDQIIGERLRSVMSIMEGASCLKFNRVLEKPDNMTYIHISNPKRERDCSHKVTRNEYGEISLVLGYDCLQQNELLHSLLHAIGLHDEVTHPERDRFIRVQWNNIRPEYRKLYRIQARDSFKTLVEYDPLSVMHFRDRAFTSNGQATVIPLISGLMIKPSEDMSQLDKLKLRLLFEHECNKRKVDDILDSCKNAFHTNDGANTNRQDDTDDSFPQSNENEGLKDNINEDRPHDGADDENNETVSKENGSNAKPYEESEENAENNDNKEDETDKNDSGEEKAVKQQNFSVGDNVSKSNSLDDNAENNDVDENVELHKSEENDSKNIDELRKRKLH